MVPLRVSCEKEAKYDLMTSVSAEAVVVQNEWGGILTRRETENLEKLSIVL